MTLARQTISFLDLPLEIREIIYEHAACEPVQHVDKLGRGLACKRHGGCLQRGLQLTCRQIYQEANYYLHGRLWWDLGNFRSLNVEMSRVMRAPPKEYKGDRFWKIQYIQGEFSQLRRVKLRLECLFLHWRDCAPDEAVRNLRAWFPNIQFLHVDVSMKELHNDERQAHLNHLAHFLEELPEHIVIDVDIETKGIVTHFCSGKGVVSWMEIRHPTFQRPTLAEARLLAILEKRNPRAKLLKARKEASAQQKLGG